MGTPGTERNGTPKWIEGLTDSESIRQMVNRLGEELRLGRVSNGRMECDRRGRTRLAFYLNESSHAVETKLERAVAGHAPLANWIADPSLRPVPGPTTPAIFTTV